LSSVWVLIGGLLILPLAGYAIFLGVQLREQRRAQRALDQQLTEQRINDDRDARQAVQIIARALLQKDLSETEAAMRIAFLAQKKLSLVVRNQSLFEYFSSLQRLRRISPF
jgi:hypothetical protein